MDSSYILSTINPVIGLLLSLTFFVIWKNHSRKTYILNWSLGFAAGSIGYSFEFFHFFIANFRFDNGVNIFLPISVLFSIRGVCLRYTGQAPDRILLSVITLTGIIACWMSIGDHNALIRGFAVSCGIATVLIIAMHAMMKVPSWDKIDLCIFLTILSLTVLLPIRPLASFLIEGAPQIDAIRVNSFWVVSLKVAGLYAWVAFAILFLLRIAADLLAEVNALSVTDLLSGILNRRGFFETAAAIVRGATPKLPVSVLLLDIDHFKKVNDTYGHQIGDQVIRNVAGLMHSNAPEAAVVGRLGGEEFAMVLPNTGRKAAFAFAEVLRTGIERQGHAEIPRDHPITVSIGLAEGTGGPLEELLHDADVALYKAKNGGRNQVGTVGAEAFRGHSMRTPERLAQSL